MIDACTQHNHHSGPGGGLTRGDGWAMHAGVASAAGLALGTAGQTIPAPLPDDWALPTVSPPLARFKHSWEVFVDSLLKEWKTQNVVSALLLS